MFGPQWSLLIPIPKCILIYFTPPNIKRNILSFEQTDLLLNATLMVERKKMHLKSALLQLHLLKHIVHRCIKWFYLCRYLSQSRQLVLPIVTLNFVHASFQISNRIHRWVNFFEFLKLEYILLHFYNVMLLSLMKYWKIKRSLNKNAFSLL